MNFAHLLAVDSASDKMVKVRVVGDELEIATLRRLEAEERAVSRRRAKLHDRLALFPSTDAERQERALSQRRRELHAEIDRLRRRARDARRPARLRRVVDALTVEVLPGMDERRQRLLRLWLIAGVLALLDLWVKHVVPTPAWAVHHRSASWAIGSTALLVAVVPLTRLPSATVTIGAAFLSGGVLGNLISGARDHLAVPNPFLIVTPGGGIAFNLADTFIVAGNLILMVALCTFVVRNRERLHGPLAFAHAMRARGRP
jgi:lipoprotein signal peptidase